MIVRAIAREAARSNYRAPVNRRQPMNRNRRTYTKTEARALLLTCLGVIGGIILCCQMHFSAPAYHMPAGTGGSVSTGGSYAPHNPGMTAAVIGGEAKAVGHAARFAGRTAFRGGIMRGIGRGFGGGTYTPGGMGFHGFGFFGF